MYRKEKRRHTIIVLLLAVVGTAAYGAPPKTGYFLLFQDEFNDNVLNESNWYYRDSRSVKRYGGFSAKDHVSVRTEDGVGFLNIAYDRQDLDGDTVSDPVGGGVISTRTFGYGYYEARIKFYDNEVGLHQSFWTAGLGYYSSYSDGYGYNEDAKADRVPWVNSCLEIDSVELDSAYNKGAANFHWHKPTFSTPSGAHKSYDASYIDTSKWIVFGFEWTPGQVIFTVDGVERHRVKYTDERYAPQEVWLTALANNNWGGDGYPEPGASMKVDYFRFYSRPFNANHAANPGFEHNGSATEAVTSWIADDGIYDNYSTDQASIQWDAATAHSGSGYLRHECATGAPAMTSRMRLSDIPNGRYKASAWVQSSGGMDTNSMSVLSSGDILTVDIPESATWQELVIDDIQVIDNRLDLAFITEGNSGTWINVDDVTVINKDFESIATIDGILDNGDPGYSESGVWVDSSLSGYNGSSTRYSNAQGAFVQWTPEIDASGTYDVFIYKVAYPGSDSDAVILIDYDGGQQTVHLDYTAGESGWVYLGTYPFAAGGAGYVRNTRTTGNARADAIAIQDPAEQAGMAGLQSARFDGSTFVVLATNLSPIGTYVLESTTNLVDGFTAVVDGPRNPTPDGDPTVETFTYVPDTSFKDLFFRLQKIRP